MSSQVRAPECGERGVRYVVLAGGCFPAEGLGPGLLLALTRGSAPWCRFLSLTCRAGSLVCYLFRSSLSPALALPPAPPGFVCTLQDFSCCRVLFSCRESLSSPRRSLCISECCVDFFRLTTWSLRFPPSLSEQ